LYGGHCIEQCPAGFTAVGSKTSFTVGRQCCLVLFGRSSCL
jgi:hypothetical protein